MKSIIIKCSECEHSEVCKYLGDTTRFNDDLPSRSKTPDNVEIEVKCRYFYPEHQHLNLEFGGMGYAVPVTEGASNYCPSDTIITKSN